VEGCWSPDLSVLLSENDGRASRQRLHCRKFRRRDEGAFLSQAGPRICRYAVFESGITWWRTVRLAVVVRATKRATLWVALACSGFSAAVRLTHRPPDEGVLVVRQAAAGPAERDDGHANRRAPTRAVRNRRGERRAEAQGCGVGVETHKNRSGGFA